MSDFQHTVLFVDDEMNILNSLKRLLRREEYRVLTASGGIEGLTLLKENEVHLVVTDQRMPGISGTDFLAQVRQEYPEVIRIILTGYTDVDSITDSINKGHIYKFFLKPWNDQNLRLEIKQALEQYDLVKANNRLNETVLAQNEELRTINEHLEEMVNERTRDLEIQNHALELSRAILEDLPFPILGVSSEELIVQMNREALLLSRRGVNIEIGKRLSDCISGEWEEKVREVFETGNPKVIRGYPLSGAVYDIEISPLGRNFAGKGVILTFMGSVNPSSDPSLLCPNGVSRGDGFSKPGELMEGEAV